VSETGAHEAVRFISLGERQVISAQARRRVIIDALEGEEDDAADSGGEDYELVG